jgi:hypothetical protein
MSPTPENMPESVVSLRSRAIGAPRMTNAARASSVKVTIAPFTLFERVIPPITSAVMQPTEKTASPTRAAGAVTPNVSSAYPASPSAAVAAEADFAHRKVHPAMNPSVGVR